MAQTLARFAFHKLSKYPHMKPGDVAVWERFVDTNRDAFERVDYDFHVGDGAEFLPTGEDTPDGRENRLYQRKIDVVGYRGGEVTLIEVKPFADVAALGQILTYRDLYAKTEGAIQDPTLMVIAEKIMAEMKDIYTRNGIAVVIV